MKIDPNAPAFAGDVIESTVLNSEAVASVSGGVGNE